MTRRAAAIWLALLLPWRVGEAGAQPADPPPAAVPAPPRRAAPARPRPALVRETAEDVALGSHLNANTVAVISGTPGGTYFRMASDLAFVLDGFKDLRVLPVMGKGAGQNAYDLRYLRGIDIGFVRTDSLDQLRKDRRVGNVQAHIAYIARLFNDELHVVAPREITDIRQLAGRKVSFDVRGSGTDMSGRAMFSGIGLAVEAVNVDQPAALGMLERGELAALVSVAAKPVAVLAEFQGGGRFHLLAVPFAGAAAESYMPAELTHADYPLLAPEGSPVRTLAVGTILAAYNWPKGSERYGRIARFVDAFFSQYDAFLKPPRHPKWREVNLTAEVPEWQRFPAAKEWLERRGGPAPEAASGEVAQFLAQRRPSGEVDRDQLYQEFLRWREGRR
ncbi:TAXI family TRAP transporter solute-binding subunit [Methylobacterium nonmethylotrophicum]|uniref:Transporter n=1 Tax=Methylobacterium nonmethylotrophicum TaxID=1141884 RepID=A0A4Z0NNJ2_9HYPH|nr:TAXI family TRAP transporter solute-binding subunit [Methylobacterium nonmethylotrophicum]TGD98265.1 transporter [Methylobacterium nonmethylotrophicum]